jgi:hypothetical protein
MSATLSGISSSEPVAVHCRCGWTGWRRPEKIKARTCPWCDGEITRWRDFGKEIAEIEAKKREILDRMIDDMRSRPSSPLEQAIADTFAPVPCLPVPYVLRTMTGEVQVFRIPASCRRRSGRRR